MQETNNTEKSETIHVNLSSQELINYAIKGEEGGLAANGALTVVTGKRTGRSPKDRFIVKDAMTADSVAWGNINQPVAPEIFSALWKKAEKYLQEREHFQSNLRVGADEEHFLPVKVLTELAWHQLFAQNLFITPEGTEDKNKPVWTIINAPGLVTNPEADGTASDATVMINFSQRQVLLCGLRYAGEMKKAMFSVLNYILPQHDVLPMHCAANMGEDGDVALFFGLSGTGKTTLSADPERYLIGDDEHGWSNKGVFNFEGGCYAKCIDLSKEREPVIWDAIRYGAIMENVVLNPETQEPVYSDGRFTQNTRAAYPRSHIAQRVLENRAGQPQNVIFLTCDLYGVLPPVAILSKQQAAYYFLSGYTALVGSTEVGQSEAIKPTFSTCFGAPFFPRQPSVYADLLMKRINETGAQVYLVNTGWTGGPYGKGGKRFDIPTTRAVIHSIIRGDLRKVQTEMMPGFNFAIPRELPPVDAKILNPVNSWQNPEAFDEYRNLLIQQFQENFKRFAVADEIIGAGPSV